jgi:hypothetical protein
MQSPLPLINPFCTDKRMLANLKNLTKSTKVAISMDTDLLEARMAQR